MADTNATTNVIIAVLGAGGIGSIIAAVVTAFMSKRKLGAEATEIITRAASGVVSTLERRLEIEEKEREADKKNHEIRIHEFEKHVENLIQAHNAERDDWKRVLQLHVAWDGIAIAKMAELGIDLPPAPPLLPDHRRY